MKHSNTDSRYISLAIEEAEKSVASYRVGCIAVASGKILARGCNNSRTYSNDGMIGESLSCHAEIDVLRKVKKLDISKKMKFYIVRISSVGELVCSAPCIDCFMTMKDFNIKNMIYIGHDGEIIKRDICEFHTTHRCGGKKAIIEKRADIVRVR